MSLSLFGRILAAASMLSLVFLSHMVSANMKLIIGLGATAGIIQQAINTRTTGFGSVQSTFLLIVYLIAVFLVCLRPFSPIALNSGKFNFDSACTNKNLSPMVDRWRHWVVKQ